MTKSTGKRELQRLREELFAGGMRLYRVLLHMREGLDWAHRDPLDRAECRGRMAAYSLVRTIYLDVLAEQKEIT